MANPSFFRSSLCRIGFICLSIWMLSYSPTYAQTFEFALIGDMPYHPDDDAKFDRLIDDINAEQELQWVMHTGDVKEGYAHCTDELIQQRFDLYSRFEAPFIITPGDNEWTDCYREPPGKYMPLERLAHFRKVFYSKPTESLGIRKMEVQSQSSQQEFELYPEHQRWEKAGVYFATLHYVGSYNAWKDFEGRTKADDEEVIQRNQAALAWMKETFDLAEEKGKGVFLMIHANPGFDLGMDTMNTKAFGAFIQALEKHVIAFGRPVILAHGDSHYFRMDKPLVGSKSTRRIENFTRVEAFGDRDIHWIRVTVDPEDVNVFEFRQELIPENFEQH